jgi:hypothetical protein
LWHYRFTISGQEYAGSTGLQATEANRKAAERYEKAQRELAKQGRKAEIRRDFATAAGDFIAWCKDVEYRQKPSTAERIRVSFASLVNFFGDMPVVSINARRDRAVQDPSRPDQRREGRHTPPRFARPESVFSVRAKDALEGRQPGA